MFFKCLEAGGAWWPLRRKERAEVGCFLRLCREETFFGGGGKIPDFHAEPEVRFERTGVAPVVDIGGLDEAMGLAGESVELNRQFVEAG